MLGIVAHHYVVNSGLMQLINADNPLAPNALFLLLFGCWGKIGINCFVLITGYFMCKSNITLKKFLKLLLEWLFYKYVILAIFVISGYQTFTLKELIKEIIPFRTISSDFTSCYMVFYLFIPFLNVLVQNMSKRQHQLLLILVLAVFSVWAAIPFVSVGSSYVFWFMALYLVASYIRLYPKAIYSKTAFWGKMSILAFFLCCASVAFIAWLKAIGGPQFGFYMFVSDSNNITALLPAICFFMFFKNVNLKYNPFINRIAASTFGVLCIHACSDTMRQWLWKDVCNNVGFYNSPSLVLHAIGSVLAIFLACTAIDQVRIFLIEKPFFRLLYKSKE